LTRIHVIASLRERLNNDHYRLSNIPDSFPCHASRLETSAVMVYQSMTEQYLNRR
jgi:hypothetical protein